MIQMLTVVLRRLDAVGEHTQDSCMLAAATVSSFLAVFRSDRDGKLRSQLRRCMIALVRSDSLHCLSQANAVHWARQPKPGDREVSMLVYFSCTLIGCLLEVAAAPDALHSFRRAVLRALTTSHLLDHLSRMIACAMAPEEIAGQLNLYHVMTGPVSRTNQVTAGPLASIIEDIFIRRSRWADLDTQLCGPGLHFLLTAMAVEVLHQLEGGPRYGLPHTAITDACSTAEAGASVFLYGSVLYCWALALVPGANLVPWRRNDLSPRAVYGLGMRAAAVCADVVRLLDSGTAPCRSGGRCGGDQAGGAEDGGEGRAAPGRPGSATAEARPGGDAAGLSAAELRQARHLFCDAAVLAVLAADDAVWAASRRRHAAALKASVAARKANVDAAASAAAPVAAPQWGTAGAGPTNIANQTAVSVIDLTVEADAAAATRQVAGEAGQASLSLGASLPPLDVCRPRQWWRAAVAALVCVAPTSDAASDLDSGGQTVMMHGHVEALLARGLRCAELMQPFPATPPPSPTQGVAAALDAGLVSCLERLLRHAHRPLLSFDVHKDVPHFHLHVLPAVLTWNSFAWLAAYGNPQDTAALVTSIGQVLRSDGMELLRIQTACVALKGDDQPDLVQLSTAMLREGLEWAADRQLAAPTAATAAGAGHGDDPSRRLLRLLSFMLDSWLEVVCGDMRFKFGLSLSVASRIGMFDGCRGPLGPAVSDLLYVAAHVVEQVEEATAAAAATAGASVAARRGSGSAPTAAGAAAGPQRGAAAWRTLLDAAGLHDVLLATVDAAVQGNISPAAVSEPLRRVLCSALVHTPERMRAALRSRAVSGVSNALELAFGPSGAMSDPSLLTQLCVLRDGAGAGAAVRPSHPTPPPPHPSATVAVALPPLAEARSLLRVCAHRRCSNLVGHSAVQLMPQPNASGDGGSAAAAAGQAAARYCSRKCREECRKGQGGRSAVPQALAQAWVRSQLRN